MGACLSVYQCVLAYFQFWCQAFICRWRACVCYRAWRSAGPCRSTAGASDVDDDAVSCVHLVDSADQCRRLAGPANVHDGDLPRHTSTFSAAFTASTTLLWLASETQQPAWTTWRQQSRRQNSNMAVTTLSWTNSIISKIFAVHWLQLRQK